MNSQTRIAILLATFNGEAFLREQIDSLYAQTWKDWILYVHDDGSKDETLPILKDYAQKHDNIILLGYPSQGGAKNNFLSMIDAVDADYYLLCDQDDKWFPDKIEKEMAKMAETERRHPRKPILIFSDLTVTDTSLKPVYDSMWEQAGIHPRTHMTFKREGSLEFVTGCTMLFNHQVKETIVHPSNQATMHDAWITLCTLKNDGILCAIHEPLLYYRQHEGNTLGASYWSQHSWGRKLLNIRRIINHDLSHWKMLKALNYGSFPKFLFYKYLYRRIK